MSDHLHFARVDVDPVDIKNTGIALVHFDQHVLGIIFQFISNPDSHFFERSELFKIGTINIHGIHSEVLIPGCILDVGDSLIIRPDITRNISLRCAGDPRHFFLPNFLHVNIQPVLPWL